MLTSPPPSSSSIYLSVLPAGRRHCLRPLHYHVLAILGGICVPEPTPNFPAGGTIFLPCLACVHYVPQLPATCRPAVQLLQIPACLLVGSAILPMPLNSPGGLHSATRMPASMPWIPSLLLPTWVPTGCHPAATPCTTPLSLPSPPS